MPVGLDVVGLGANSVDTVLQLPAAPEAQGPNAKMRISREARFCGGQMATALATCASLGLRVKYVGAVGRDENGNLVRQELERRGIDTTHLVARDAASQHAFILVDEASGERIVLWDRDARLALHEDDVPADAIAGGRLLHVDDVDQEAAIRAAGIAGRMGMPVTSDLDRLTDLTEALVAAVSVPIFAEHVPPALTGEVDPERALRKLRGPNHGPLVVTLGPRGALAVDGDDVIHEPAFAVPIADTTGAGDVFRGGFIYGLLRGWPTRQTVWFANAAAAVSCTRLGAMNGVPTLEEIWRLVGREGTDCAGANGAFRT